MNSTRGRHRHIGEQARTELLKGYRESGLTQREFAARNGVSLSWLSIWLRRSNGEHSRRESGGFVRLPVDLEVGGKPPMPYRIGFPGGQSLEVSRGFNMEEVRELCQLLGGR